MKTKNLFKSMVVITGLLLQFNLLAQAQPVMLHVETAGTLSSLIDESQKYEITDLTLTGNLNGTDIRFIREMAGRSYDGDRNYRFGRETNGKLENLNLSGASIVSGGEYYLKYYNYDTYLNIYTTSNIITSYMFYTCNKLKSIILPNSVTWIVYTAFTDCTNLQAIIVSEQNANYSDIDGILYNKCESGAKKRFQPLIRVNN
ncbi:MAG: leucine-rich repeat domain-containing protein [Dysgonamonadaceae bacterium]|jgi:hypothetical protein|nr:leucine-rich repeat domain-containing protein [Dysgonamonadaceae bacterium]